MASFSYVAIDSSGKQVKGTMEANDVDAVKGALKSQGMIVTSIGTASALSKDIKIGGSGVKARDLQLFCTQFASILHAGVTIIQAMDMMVDQTTNKNLKAACADVKVLIEKGDTLSAAMTQHDDVFPEMLINMVEAGEQSGSLEVSLQRMATQFEKDAKLSSMVMQALIYPVVLLIVIIGVVILMLVKVVPQFQETFNEVDAELPKLTLIVVAASHAVMHTWYIILGVVILIVVAFKLWARTESGAMIIGRTILKLPLFGDLVIKQASARLARTLSTLTTSGIPLITAVEMCGKIMTNRVVKTVVEDAKSDIEKGVPLSQPLEASGVFPPLLYQMTRIGEETGNLEEMLDNCAQFYEEEVENATQAIATVVEPLIIVVMAGIVAPIIGAVMMPMLSIYNAVENA
ncbi:MAG: type II secretion system F family protein [Lachnospiraceae bacterium]|nr:type II secretion system F family protein [Lachnospiraceae bacterium]